MSNFRNLVVYDKSRELVQQVYKIAKTFPEDEKFILGSQIRRAAISITSNIAEGMGRMTSKDQVHFLHIAYGSLMEVTAQLDLALDFGYINQECHDSINRLIDEISKMLSAMCSIRTSK